MATLDLDTSALEQELDTVGDLLVDLRKAVAENTAVIRDRVPLITHAPQAAELSPAHTPTALTESREPILMGFQEGDEVTSMTNVVGTGVTGVVILPSSDAYDARMVAQGYVKVARDDQDPGYSGEENHDWFQARRTVLTTSLSKYVKPQEVPIWEREPTSRDTVESWNRRLIEEIVKHNSSQSVSSNKKVITFTYERPAVRFQPAWDTKRETVYLRPSATEVIGQYSQDVIVKGIEVTKNQFSSFKLERIKGYAKVVAASAVPSKLGADGRRRFA